MTKPQHSADDPAEAGKRDTEKSSPDTTPDTLSGSSDRAMQVRAEVRKRHVPQAPEPSGDDAIDEVRADIATTRAQLADAVDALSSKLDVREQGKQKAVEAKAAVTEATTHVVHAAQPYRVPIVAGAAALVALAVAAAVRRRS